MTDNERKTLLTPSAYKALVASVGKTLAASETAGRRADSGKAVAYWEIGDQILEAGLVGRDHYGELVVERLAADLEVDPQIIRRCVAFRRVYDRKKLYLRVQVLTWSIYRQLIEVRDAAVREYYEKKAAEEAWTRDRLKAAIAGREYAREVLKEKPGPTILKRPTEAEYVFKAEVVHVVDGDSLVLNIRCGFRMVREEERIRLAKLNTPEIETKKGKAARIYVQERLAQARTVVVKTEKADDHGRYIGHVFYSFEDERVSAVYAKGIYLNEELLREGYAERM
jgi:micrococcal nuclease